MKKKKSQSRLILLDAHAILHRAYHALPEFASSKGEPTGALYGLSTMLLKIITDLKPDYIAACFDLPGPTYRHEAYEAYKGQRKKTDEELVSQMIRSRDVFTAFSIPMYDHPGFEADDMLGTIVEQVKRNKDLDVIIASGDMDTLQLVDNDKVRVYTLKKGINDTIMYNEKAVLERFNFDPELLPDYKGLRGDPSDNIVGIKGVGEKTAQILISTFGTLEAMYKVLKKNPEKMKEAGITDRMITLLLEGEEEAIFSKMLATIRRDAPIQFSLPDTKWGEHFDKEKVLALFADLDFRTLGARLKGIGAETLGTQDSLLSEKNGAGKENEEIRTVPDIPKKEWEDLAIAVWVLNSNVTNPELEDIYRITGTTNLDEARRVLTDKIHSEGLDFVYEKIEKPLILIIEKMDRIGVKIDKKYLATLSKDYHKELERLQKIIWEAAGEEFNINSPKQLGEILFTKLGLGSKNQKKTSTGQKSTKESELEKLADSHPVIKSILEYRELQKLLSTYIDSIPTLLDENDRLHTNLRQASTTTGRMSSINPNVQNIPIKTELGRNIRKAFITEEGFAFASFDYSQIELRVAAILSGDEKLLEIFKSGEDVHSAVASYVFNVPVEKVDKEMRRKAKVINFGILYGMGVNALRQNLGGTRDEAQQFYTEYFKRFTGLAQYLDKVKSDAERKGYTETLFGRRRYFEGLRSKIPFIRAAAERMAINAPIQGTATADVIKLAMIKIDAFITKEGLEDKVRMLLQVHDELVFEIEESLVKKVAPQIKAVMESVLTMEQAKGVLCVANAEVGKNWGETEEIT